MRRLLLWLVGFGVVLVAIGLTARDLAAAAGFDPLRDVVTSARQVALTFEVSHGQSAVDTILQTLGPAHATFFVTGAWAKGHADLVRRIVAAGDEVESLGNRDVALNRYPEPVVREELAAGVAALRALGVTPHFLRPPAGAYDPTVLRLAQADDLRLCLWDVDALDWARPGPDAVAARVLAGARPGAIIRLQADDGIPDTLQALPAILRGLAAGGFAPVTLAQLTAS